MRTVAKIIDAFGGLPWLKRGANQILLEGEPDRRLVIHYLGPGPRRLSVVGVAQYREADGRLASSHDMQFEVSRDLGLWLPLCYHNDERGIRREAIFRDERSGGWMLRRELAEELQSFAAAWDRKLRTAGYLAVARRALQSQS
jgi:hypothetical protein